jgi:hypothetical protein
MKFKVTYEVTVELDIDRSVIKEATSADWRKSFYDLHTPEDVADHIGFNAIANDIRDVTALDGFAHIEKGKVKYIRFDHNAIESRVEAPVRPYRPTKTKMVTCPYCKKRVRTQTMKDVKNAIRVLVHNNNSGDECVGSGRLIDV